MVKFLSRSQLSLIMASFALALISTHASARSATAVIELFTSQGCSSCPPADELLAEYAKRDGVLAISMPVDYWDYLGWTDTLASPANSQRQRDYAARRGDRMVYTPQVVVNGIEAAPGYSQRIIDSTIESTSSKLETDSVLVDIKIDDGTILIDVAAADANSSYKSGTLWLLLFEKQVVVPVARGENAGHTITYTNVVREMTPVGTWNGDKAVFTLPKADVMSRGHEGCAVLLQSGPTGPIVGAAILDNW